MESLRIYSSDALQPLDLRGSFGNDHPIELDLGCGKGRFLLARAQAHPEINMLGLDRMLRRIRKIDRKAMRAGLTNVRLFRMEAYYAVTYLLPPESISACYILFPDPWPKTRHHRNRLFNTAFMDSLYRSLRPGAMLHVATDHSPYFEAIRRILQKRNTQFEETEPWQPCEEERTDFELLYRDQKPIVRGSYQRSHRPL